MDNNPLISPEIVPTPQTQNNSFQPPPGQPVTPPENLTGKPRRKKLTLIAIALILVLAGGIIYYFVTKNVTTTKTAGNETNQQLASAKPQFSYGDSVAGYLKYDSTKFKEVKSVGLPSVRSADANVNVVIVAANVVSYGESGLYLYDLSTNKSYKLTSGGEDPRIMSDHFLVYGFDEGSGSDKKLGARLLDLKTGEDKIIFAAAPESVPGTVCCSVSPNGFKLALPQKEKITVWDIRSGTAKDYPATLNPIGEGFSRTAANDYAVEMSYASPVWADNDSVVYADQPATKYIIVDNATTKPVIDTNLFLLNLTNGESNQLTTDKSGIYDIYTREEGGLIFTNEVTVDTNINQFTEQTLDNEPEVLATTFYNFVSLSPKGDKLYIFPTLYEAGGYTSVDTNTKSTKTFNPLPTDISKVSQIIPKGWAGEDRIILEILDTAGTTDHEYIAIYNTTSDKIEQYTTVK